MEFFGAFAPERCANAPVVRQAVHLHQACTQWCTKEKCAVIGAGSLAQPTLSWYNRCTKDKTRKAHATSLFWWYAKKNLYDFSYRFFLSPKRWCYWSGDRIWTCDLLVPNQTRYQTALHLANKMEPIKGLEPLTCGLRNRCSTNWAILAWNKSIIAKRLWFVQNNL